MYRYNNKLVCDHWLMHMLCYELLFLSLNYSVYTRCSKLKSVPRSAGIQRYLYIILLETRHPLHAYIHTFSTILELAQTRDCAACYVYQPNL